MDFLGNLPRMSEQVSREPAGAPDLQRKGLVWLAVSCLAALALAASLLVLTSLRAPAPESVLVDDDATRVEIVENDRVTPADTKTAAGAASCQQGTAAAVNKQDAL